MADLQITHSIELTIDNILEDRLPVPRNAFDDMEETDGGTSNSNNNSNIGSYPAATASDYYINVDGDDFTSNSATLTTTTTSTSSPSITTSNQTSTSSSIATTPASPTDPQQIQNNLNRAYEIEQNATPSIFGNQADLLRDDSVESQPDDEYAGAASSSSSPSSSTAFLATSLGVLGDRFSKSSQEREKILQRRKEQMLILARKRYLEKTKSELNMPTEESEVRYRSRNRDTSEL